MPSSYFQTISDCSSINSTHIQANWTAIGSLNREEMNLLYSTLQTVNATMGTCFKQHFVTWWQLFACMYALVGLAGAFGNIYMIAIMFLKTSFRRCINFLLFNLCLSNLVKCLVVLPVSLYVLLIAHW